MHRFHISTVFKEYKKIDVELYGLIFDLQKNYKLVWFNREIKYQSSDLFNKKNN